MNVSKTCNELESNKYYKILISIEVIMYVTDHLKRSFVIMKWRLYLVCLGYNILVNAFYFHKYSYIFELIKCIKPKQIVVDQNYSYKVIKPNYH